MKLGSLVTVAAVGFGAYWVGKQGLGYWRERAGLVAGRLIPPKQAALTAGFKQAIQIVHASLQKMGVQGVATPGVFDGQPALLVSVPPGTNLMAVSRQLPTVAAGIRVVLS